MLINTHYITGNDAACFGSLVVVRERGVLTINGRLVMEDFNTPYLTISLFDDGRLVFYDDAGIVLFTIPKNVYQ